MIVVIADEAGKDLGDIGDYISQSDPGRAATFIDEIVGRCFAPSSMPYRYAVLPRYKRQGIRHFPHGRYVVYYRIDAERIEIVRILHSARDHSAILAFDDEDGI
ncbi:plasmid stabilization protein [Neorhizobium sp. SOG26]|uniref:type II toxin-antitoxin system RelE/ParE family toxin n=1 Tax=Neorhizobium sp. SOG26 TaxID=2060726 RepID=UPI000E5925B9|nr:type II toxin-antitoxin system RelE/ParE family toxin [Neorhizobium sp. SOG26]AXV14733.1 plasmid stabilization protein [Neorhizobium sp. SOG26]